MDVCEKLESILERVKKVGYWKVLIPSELDNDIREQIRNYRSAGSDERNLIKSDLSDGVVRLLLFFSERMATYALRIKSQKVFDDGLMALEIVLGKADFAEILMCFSLYNDVSQRHGLIFKLEEGDRLFKEALSGFLSRVDEDKSIEAMGYAIVEDESKQLTYKRTW